MTSVHWGKEMMRLIDADKLIALLNKKYGGDENINESVLYLVGAISGASTVDAESVRHGHWVIERGETVMHCNSCGWAYEYYGGLEEEWNFCPHCGAKMDEVEDDNA